MTTRSNLILATLLTWASSVGAVHKPFSIHDDVLAHPQFEVRFPDEYVLEPDARSRLERYPISKSRVPDSPPSSSLSSTASGVVSDQLQYTDLSQVRIQDGEPGSHDDRAGPISRQEDEIEGYQEMIWESQRFLCEIPKTSSGNNNTTSASPPTDQEKELARATDRGLELLREMEGKCMYFVAGWWSYSFCYMNQVRQFHALPPGNGVPVYPPAEDPAAHSYVLGRFRQVEEDRSARGNKKSSSKDLAKLQTRGESRYLVQYLDDGTMCDLTGRSRRVEVQFHCHPQSTDRIGWIKEVTTCSYLMIIYTPRLCNDVAFLPPREDEAHHITCREIISPERVPEWEEAKALRETQQLDDGAESLPVVGDIEVGAMKYVGKDGKRIEKGRVASAGEEKIEVIARSDGGEVTRLSKEELKRVNLDPEKIESLKRQLEELADGKDWKLELVDANGEIGLRGIVDTDDEGEEIEGDGTGPTGQTQQPKGERQQHRSSEENHDKESENDESEISEEIYKEEL